MTLLPVENVCTPDQFLAFAIPLERRKIQDARGDVKPFPPLPSCPLCSQPVASVVESDAVPENYTLSLGCHKLISRVFGFEDYPGGTRSFYYEESLLAKARKAAAALERR